MVYVRNWEDFEIAAENMYIASPDKCRLTMKYIHSKGQLMLKITDNAKSVQYKAENVPELKKIEKFCGNIMSHMASQDTE